MVEKTKAVVKSFPVRRGNFLFKIHMNEEKGTTVAIFDGVIIPKREVDEKTRQLASIFQRICTTTVGKTQLHKEDTFDAKIGVRWAIKKCFNALRAEMLNYMNKCNQRVLKAMDELEFLIHCDGSSPKEGTPEYTEYIHWKSRKNCSCKCGGGK